MIVLVTGANGFVGSHLVRRLAANHSVVALARDPTRLRAMRIEALPADLSQPVDSKAWPATVDAIIHLAQANVSFPESAQEMFAVNTASTQRLLDYARRSRAFRFILASSGDVYGDRRGLSKESDAARPAGYYAVTKYASELIAMSYRDYTVPCVLRLFQPFGPGQSGRLIPKLAERVRKGEPVLVNDGDRPLVTPLYIDDAVAAIEKTLTVAYTGVINLAGDEAVSVRRLAEQIGSAVGRTPVFEASGRDCGDLAGDNAMMKKLLEPGPLTRLAEGLARTFAHE